jgi:hypothetical protein
MDRGFVLEAVKKLQHMCCSFFNGIDLFYVSMFCFSGIWVCFNATSSLFHCMAVFFLLMGVLLGMGFSLLEG